MTPQNQPVTNHHSLKPPITISQRHTMKKHTLIFSTIALSSAIYAIDFDQELKADKQELAKIEAETVIVQQKIDEAQKTIDHTNTKIKQLTKEQEQIKTEIKQLEESLKKDN